MSVSSRPQLIPTKEINETFAGVTYSIEGELVPVLTIDLPKDRRIYFEHHVLLWKDTAVDITARASGGIKGAFSRKLAGMPIFMTEAAGPGQIAFSRDGVGHVFAIHLHDGHELHVREHQFLAATDNVSFGFERIKGISNTLFGGSGLFIDKFRSQGDGLLFLHGYGNVFQKTLAAGEQFDVEPGGWVCKDPSVRMETSFQSIATGLLASLSTNGLVMNRFTGPGSVGIQSMYLHMPTNE